MNQLRTALLHTSIVVLMVVFPLLAWTGFVEALAASDQGMATRSDLYRQAQRALDQKDWPTAESLFGEVADAGGEDADAALYWQAYAQIKRGRRNAARKTLAELQRRYPDSSWLDDAKALSMEAQPQTGESLEPTAEEDEELKLYALNSLMHVRSERAIPILDDFLAGDHSLEMKEKALFVLSQSGAPEAREILVQIAKGQRQPELSAEAIEYLGLSGGEDTGELLQQIYDASQDREVKEQALEAMMLGDHKERVLAAARGESDPRLRAEAVELLGVMVAVAELRELYGSESSLEVKEAILEGLFIADDAETLAELARSEQNPELRMEAIEYLGLTGSATATATLQSLYASETDREVKEQILEAYFLQENAKALIEIIRTEQDQELRKEALEYLSLMDSDEAVDFLLEVLEG